MSWQLTSPLPRRPAGWAVSLLGSALTGRPGSPALRSPNGGHRCGGRPSGDRERRRSGATSLTRCAAGGSPADRAPTCTRSLPRGGGLRAVIDLNVRTGAQSKGEARVGAPSGRHAPVRIRIKGPRSCGGPYRNASSGLTSVFRTSELRLLQNFRWGSGLRTSLSWTMRSFGAVAPSPLRLTDPLNRFTASLVNTRSGHVSMGRRRSELLKPGARGRYRLERPTPMARRTGRLINARWSGRCV